MDKKRNLPCTSILRYYKKKPKTDDLQGADPNSGDTESKNKTCNSDIGKEQGSLTQECPEVFPSKESNTSETVETVAHSNLSKEIVSCIDVHPMDTTLLKVSCLANQRGKGHVADEEKIAILAVQDQYGKPPSDDAGPSGSVAGSTSQLLLNDTIAEKLSRSDQQESLHVNDIGRFIGKNIDDYTKFQLLENPWQPPESYVFPYSMHNKCGKEVKRRVGHHHLKQYSWLVFSDFKQGLFCKFCPWFVPRSEAGYQRNVKLQKFATKPLISFAKLTGKTGDLEEHMHSKYHKEAVQAGKNFVQTYQNPANDVLNQLNQQRLTEIEENKERLRPILKTIILHGRENIPLRGHRDDGDLFSNSESESHVNDGTFRALLRFRIDAGDVKLEKHLRNTSARATYISKTVQNDLIVCCGNEITDIIVKRVQKAGLYSVIFDETTDISHTSQLSLVLRYVSNDPEVHIREDFVSFVDVFSDIGPNENYHNKSSEEVAMTGKRLGQIVLHKLKGLNLPLDQCVGIGTDGCSVMLSSVCGAVSEIKKEAIHGLQCPCFNHRLNNSISKSSKVQAIRNAVGVMTETIAFFTASAKRNSVLVSILQKQLSGLCETRWIERHDGVIQFTEDLPKIIEALEMISNWHDIKTAGKASSLISALLDSQFLVSLFCLVEVLSLTLPLSRTLQKSTLDVQQATDMVGSTIATINNRRYKAAEYFSSVFEKIEIFSKSLDVEIKVPRLCGRQSVRPNYSSEKPEDYYRLSTFIPLLDHVLNDLKSRFTAETMNVFNLSFLMPERMVQISSSQLKENVLKIWNDFTWLLDPKCSGKSARILDGEVDLWKEKWAQAQKDPTALFPKTSLDALIACDMDVYPMIYKLLHLFATLPVSNATSERSFSTLRLLKTWLRSQMSESRLIGLALLYIHRDIFLDVDKVIERFSKTKKRRLSFNI